jgi:acetyl-CoA synthetase
MTSRERPWTPGPRHLERAVLRRLIAEHGLADYAEFMARSITDPEWFWRATLDDIGWVWTEPFERVLDLEQGKPWARWFTGGRTNLTLNAVDRHVTAGRGGDLALVFDAEDGQVTRYTYAELQREVNRFAGGLTGLGVGSGDRVGVYLPMIPEVVIAILAIPKIGAIYTPIFSGYAGHAVATRLADCGAKVLITADGFLRRGEVVEMKAQADEAAAFSPTVEKVIVAERTGRGRANLQPGRDVTWSEVASTGDASLETLSVDAEHPFMIIYTSGTTGRPKGCVHTHDGFPIKTVQDMRHLFDVQRGDVVFWFTDIGWMMGPWTIMGALTLGATLVIAEGAPDYPDPGRLWSLIEKHEITHFGVSPTVVRALQKYGTEPAERVDKTSLYALGSTGEPWTPEAWTWLFEKVGGSAVPIINYSGGTEISGGIVGCTVIQPQGPCEFTTAAPGIDADVVDDQGRPVRGGVGELIVRNVSPGMTRGFWNDPDRYLEAYWSKLPGVWVHGDWARLDADGFWLILGRSDDTIKVAGKRVGPAEVESALSTDPRVLEAAAIGVPDAVKGEVVICFAVLRPGHEAGAEVTAELRERVAAELGKALRPERVHLVAELPKTRSGKVMRRVLRAAYLGLEPGDLSSLDNPAAIAAVRGLAGGDAP